MVKITSSLFHLLHVLSPEYTSQHLYTIKSRGIQLSLKDYSWLIAFYSWLVAQNALQPFTINQSSDAFSSGESLEKGYMRSSFPRLNYLFTWSWKIRVNTFAKPALSIQAFPKLSSGSALVSSSTPLRYRSSLSSKERKLDEPDMAATPDILDPESSVEIPVDEKELKDTLSQPPPVNSSYLPLPWKGRLGYVSRFVDQLYSPRSITVS